MDIHEIVVKLVGQIEPVGETREDEKRLKNLKIMTALVDNLLFDIHQIRHYKSRVEYSIKVAGEHAEKFINDVKEEY